MPRQHFVLGAGGHGRVVLDAMLATGVSVAGVLDPAMTVGDLIFGVPVLGGDEFLDQLAAPDVLLLNGVGANPSVRERMKLFEDLTARGFSFEGVRHPSTVVGRECKLDVSSQIMARTVLQNRVRIGSNAVINTGASIDHDCVIGAHAFVSPGVVLSGSVSVGERAFLGAGAVVLPGIRIGAGAVVGAGSLVRKDVSAGWIVSGNPAKKIGSNA